MNSNFFRNNKGAIIFVIVIGVIAFIGGRGNLAGIFSGKSSKEETGEIVRQYIDENPQVILDSVMKLQESKMKEAQAKAQETVKESKSALESTDNTPFAGKADSGMVLVQFFDYRCGHCKQSAKDLSKLLAENPNIKIIYRNLPVLGPDSLKAAQASLAVYKLYPALFNQFHNDLLAVPNITGPEIDKLFVKYNMNKESLDKEMQSEQVAKALDANKELAGKIGLRGVPAYVINGELAAGAVNYEMLKTKLGAK